MAAVIVRVGETHGAIIFEDPTPDRFLLLGEEEAGLVLMPRQPAGASRGDDDGWIVMKAEVDRLLNREGFVLTVDTQNLEGEELQLNLRQFVPRAVAYAQEEGHSSIALMPYDAPEWGITVRVAQPQ